jgi:hypothetical protein
MNFILNTNYYTLILVGEFDSEADWSVAPVHAKCTEYESKANAQCKQHNNHQCDIVQTDSRI